MCISLNEKNVLKKIRYIEICKDIDKYIEDEKRLPQYYCEDKLNVKAVVLGCDPSNDYGYEFKKVFGLHNEDIKKYKTNFFNDIECNLKSIGLSKSNIYVQNLCRNYFLEETGKYFNNKQLSELYCKGGLIYRKNEFNDIEWKEKVRNDYNNNRWCKVASEWVDLLIKDLTMIDKDNELPVFVTSQYLLLPLIKVGYENVIENAAFYYKDRTFIESGYIKKEQNKLQRTIIPLFRHCTYILDENEMENRIKTDNKCIVFLKNIEIFKKRNSIYRKYLRNFILNKE